MNNKLTYEGLLARYKEALLCKQNPNDEIIQVKLTEWLSNMGLNYKVVKFTLARDLDRDLARARDVAVARDLARNLARVLARDLVYWAMTVFYWADVSVLTVGIDDKLCHKWLPLLEAMEAGCYRMYFTDTELVYIECPSIEMDDNGSLHSDSKPAVKWVLDIQWYFWHGLRVDKRIIMNPETITVAEIESQNNAEIRRVLVQRYGYARYIQDSGAVLVHEDWSGKLWRKDEPDDEPIYMIELDNHTVELDGTRKKYFIGIDPYCYGGNEDNGIIGDAGKIAHAALASTYRGSRGQLVFVDWRVVNWAQAS